MDTNQESKSEMIEKIRKLLALSKSSNQHEAELAAKVTPKQIEVRNEHGNSSKFWRETGRAVGYSDSIVFV